MRGRCSARGTDPETTRGRPVGGPVAWSRAHRRLLVVHSPRELLSGPCRCCSGMVPLVGPDWEEVNAMAMEMWVSLGGLLVAVLALHAALSRPIRRLESAIGELRSELKADVGGLRSEMSNDLGALRS